MRLTHLKLAGFKSFVDPTVIHVPGPLVGVVGPNGCGKSNIIDAVRWVLGESRASALRGDSMMDVIFNGSSRREPVARASVELAFDNSLGKAAGAWSQYAEISVKRVLQRDGESSYFINNTHVRRRDVHDIFLGTGLGPRAYAIIEQGMISRIIEAKPEDLRVFLEEAAGISKYKERRRETESRLADTRENLSRVDDIRQELEAQIGKLEAQAQVATRFQELSGEKLQKQNLLALLRRNEAQVEAERQARDIERSGVELEAETARLRNFEKELEQTRAEHYAAADAMNAAQADLYQANSAVASLESEIRFVTETRQRIEAQLAQARALCASCDQQSRELHEAQAEWRARLEEASASLAGAQEKRAQESSRLPEAEEGHRTAQQGLQGLRQGIGQSEQAARLEQAHSEHARKTLQGLDSRAQRLESERAELAAPSEEALEKLADELAESMQEIERQQALLQQVEESLGRLQSERASSQETLQGLEKELSGLNSKLLTLQEIQRHVDEDRSIEDWLGRHVLGAAPRLWQRLHVEPGWETAIESVLRERLHALEVADPESLQRLVLDPPPGRATLYLPSAADAPASSGARNLADLVACEDEPVRAILQAWLTDCYAVEGVPDLDARLALGPRAVLVNREGHQFSRYGVSFHAASPADSGLFARQREIEGLEQTVAETRERISAARAEFDEASSQQEEHSRALSSLRAAGTALKQRHHESELSQVRRLEERDRCAIRFAQIDQELGEIAQLKEHELANAVEAEGKAAALQEELTRLRDEESARSDAFSEAEAQLRAQRERLQQAERDEQAAQYSERNCTTKITDIETSLQKLQDQQVQAVQSAQSLEQELAAQQDEGLREQLQHALTARAERERALAQARASQDGLAERLRAGDEARLAVEQKLQPLRDRIAELRLKEQAARLNFEQHAAQLLEAGADEESLLAVLKEGQKAGPLQAEITRLTNAIAELGAINMAALEELSTSQDRKTYLDAQSIDLTEALDILESAIRRIDRETRELLQNTFTTVNKHFGELFPALFGGGEARLEITGEEVLDAGVQVIARPPGKKNSSIHLLSGGEKALTAISLVFAMFQLNPAPFCLLDEVDAPLDDANTERFCGLVQKMSAHTQFLFISHNKLTMEMATQLVGVTMQEQGVSRVVAVDMEQALKMREALAA